MSAQPNHDHREPAPDIHRALPHNLESEMGLLGSMLLAPHEVIDDCIARISAQAFYEPRHQTIFALLAELWNEQRPADLITLTQALRQRKQLDAVGGPAYLTSLIDFTPTAANASYYLDFVKEKHTLRRIIATCTSVASRAYQDAGEIDTLLGDAEAGILGICEAATGDKGEVTLKTQVAAVIEEIERSYDNRGALSGLSTGLSALDELTNGLQRSQLFVIAARPSMGKTALAMNIAEHVAIECKKPVAVFSLEMSSRQLVRRLLCSLARVNDGKIRKGFLSERDFPSLTNAAGKLADCGMFIDDTSGLSILELRAKARRLKRKHGVELIIVDYLQLLRGTSKRAQDNRQLEITEISNGLKAMSKELDIPVLALAQLNRNPENRKGGKPRVSDLRESGSLEQDADVVGLLYRSEQYAEDEEAKEELSGEAILDIAKQRDGPLDEVKLTFLKQFCRFEDRAPERSTVSRVEDLR